MASSMSIVHLPLQTSRVPAALPQCRCARQASPNCSVSVLSIRCTPRAQMCAAPLQALSRRALLSTAGVVGGAAACLPSLAREDLSDAFRKDTRALSDALTKYMTLDPYDKERIASYGIVKTDGKKWIAAHARGGSAPGQAAKRMYVAVDAVTGHITANGAAPLPPNKVKFVTKTLKEVEVFLEENK